MSLSTREQFWAFALLVLAIMVLGLTPVVMAGFSGKVIPDMLIAVSDKTVTGLIGVLGSVATMVFRTNRADEVRAENTGKAMDAIAATANSAPPGAPTGTEADPFQTEIVNAPHDPVPTTKGAPKP